MIKVFSLGFLILYTSLYICDHVFPVPISSTKPLNPNTGSLELSFVKLIEIKATICHQAEAFVVSYYLSDMSFSRMISTFPHPTPFSSVLKF